MGILKKYNDLKNQLEKLNYERQTDKAEKNKVVSIICDQEIKEYRIGDLVVLQTTLNNTNETKYFLCEEDFQAAQYKIFDVISEPQLEEFLAVKKNYVNVFNNNVISDTELVKEEYDFRSFFPVQYLMDNNYKLSETEIVSILNEQVFNDSKSYKEKTK